MRPVRAFISDGIFERFSLQLAMQQAEGIRNIMEDVQVDSIELAAATATSQFDTLHLRIRASATDYQVYTETDREVPGTRRAEDFVEYWSFHRRHGARRAVAEARSKGSARNAAVGCISSTRLAATPVVPG